MNPTIISIEERKLIGKKSQMLQHQFENIVALWKQFMPKKHLIKNTINNELIALQVYSDYGNFKIPFDIWACVEVSNLEALPEQMLSFIVPEGLYAVFLHKGMNAGATYQRIMSEWLPASGYAIDDRPHFQIMGENYKNGSPDSEEDFYVPVKKV
jgi:AraC family transcriptional regulator